MYQDENKIAKRDKLDNEDSNKVHCHHFVMRKKRYCRMTVRPGRQYCGEHEPQPEDDQADKRITCPNDPKHTVYVSKLKKHLTICNARAVPLPPYIIHDINSPPELDEDCPRVPLSEVPEDILAVLINKIDQLYETHIKDNIRTLPEREIHPAVAVDFNEPHRTESSLRHLRQASRLMWLVEEEGLVDDETCYVELGAGKGQLSYYMGTWWCGGSSRVLAVDRAALRHKRERRSDAAGRLRAELAHLALGGVPQAAQCQRVVALAKHLCGAGSDLAARCVAREPRARGLLLATCCHHRCRRRDYLANDHLQELGISGAELNIMLSVVSWATCGDGRGRERRDGPGPRPEAETAARAERGRRAKALLDWGRVLYLRGLGFDAKLARYVPTSVSLENMCIIAKRNV